ncbi:viral A-type inclusion protein [Persicitalea sp.]|uniref:viral A-type inclusion protein n=1 Tax=Persicitalea sp. TaxID=3100273 RepID=UPI003593CE8F
MRFGIGLMMLTHFALAACNQNGDRVKELEDEVMAIHDEVMPKQGEIMSLKKQLSTKLVELDSLQQEGVSSTTFAEQRLRALELSQSLATADSLMMEWMYAYRGDSAKALPAGDALVYFRLEKDKISDVQKRTNESLEAAREFLK